MSDAVNLLIWDNVLKGTYAACVTIAAMHFDKPGLLCWYLLMLFMGHTYRNKTGNNTAEK